MIAFPNIDPIIFEIGPIALRWYGLAYVAGFILGLSYFKYLIRKKASQNLTIQHADDLLIWIVFGVILGGRFGYTMFYNAPFFMENPSEIIKIWNGGMSFHGGFLGATIATFTFSYKHKINFLDIADKLAPSACIGLFFGRIANFINGELWGRTTDIQWAMIFPLDPTALPRHPSQLYEALLEGAILFLILHLFTKTNHRKGQVGALFLLGYGAFRTFIEFFREPDGFAHLQGGMFEWVTMGQILSLPMAVLGAILFFIFKYRK